MHDFSGRNWTLHVGHVIDSLNAMEAESVHLDVSSPPYWGLRAYGTAPQTWEDGWRGELGSEPTIEMFIEHLCEVYDAVHRVLHPSGVAVVNLGDSYNAGREGGHAGGINGASKPQNAQVRSGVNAAGLKPGNLCLVPHRFALAMQARGWILRETNIWAKAFSGQFSRGSCMPESVSGWRWERCRVKVKAAVHAKGGYRPELFGHDDPRKQQGPGGIADPMFNAEWQPCPGCKKCEPNDGYVLRKGSWRHTQAHELIFVFAKTGDYYGDGVAVKEKASANTHSRGTKRNPPIDNAGIGHDRWCGYMTRDDEITDRNPRNVLHYAPDIDMEAAWLAFLESWQNPSDVLHVGTQPFSAAHFATFPEAIPHHYIKAFTSDKGCCPDCGMPWARMVDSEAIKRERPADKTARHHEGNGVNSCGNTVAGVKTTTKGWLPTCSCGSPPVPCTVLDHFAGSGTSVRAAIDLDRIGVGCELNPEYAGLAVERITKSVEAPKKAIDPLPNQMDLFSGATR